MPNYFKPDWLEDWKKEREKGMLRYVATNGLGLAFICIIFDLIINKRNLFAMDTESALLNGGIFIAGGLLYGIISWLYNEWKLKKSV